MNISLTNSIVIEPTAPARSCVIWLHGLGADGYDFADIVPSLELAAGLRTRFIFPHAPVMPVTLNGGLHMPAWFDLYNLNFDGKQDEAGINRAAAALSALLDQQQEQGILSEKIILAGFSQGGALALYCGLCYPQRLAGIMGLSTVLPPVAGLTSKIGNANRDTSIFLAHGTDDAVIPIRFAFSTRDRLQQLGYPIEWNSYEMEHSVNAEEVKDISAWMQRHLN